MAKIPSPVAVLLMLSACVQPFHPSDETMAQVNSAFHVGDVDRAKMDCLLKYPLHPGPEAPTSGEAFRCILAIDPSDQSARAILKGMTQ
jgi:hypothetical protein